MQTTALHAAPVASQALFSRASVRPRRSGARVALVRAAAEPELPKGVTLPKRSPVSPPPKFGFVDNAERLNSRAAMIGFFGILIVELITNKALLSEIGFTVGQGLPFEF